MIIPDTLASIVTAPVGWIPGMGMSGKKSADDVEKKADKLRRELEDLLAGTCPLCENVVSGLDKPFVKEGEVDSSWAV